MKVLEVIHMRSTGSNLEEICEHMSRSFENLKGGTDTSTLYRRAGLRSDLAIHIRRREEGGDPRRSPMGLRLAESLKPYGMVEHTVWEEMESDGSL